MKTAGRNPNTLVRLYKYRVCECSILPFLTDEGACITVVKTLKKGLKKKAKSRVGGATRNPMPKVTRGSYPMRPGLSQAAYFRKAVTTKPVMHTAGNKLTVIHSEMFNQHKQSSTGYDKYTYPVNPGSSAVFPWLASIANQYESYHFKRLSFKWYPRVGTTVSGVVGTVLDFDPTDEAPPSVFVAMQNINSTSFPIYMPGEYQVNLAGVLTPRHLVRGGVRTGEEVKFYDVGNVTLYNDGCNFGVGLSLGYWQVSYEVELYTPEPQARAGGEFRNDIVDQGFPSLGLLPQHQARTCFNLVGKAMVFTEPFEGLLHLNVASGDIAVITPNAWLNSTAAYTVISQCLQANVGATITIAFRAAAGEQITFNTWACLISSFTVCLARGVYAQFC